MAPRKAAWTASDRLLPQTVRYYNPGRIEWEVPPALTTDSAPGAEASRSDVLALEKEAFSFLAEEGFTRRKIVDITLLTTFAYVSPEVVFETSMDWRDRYASVYVCRAIDGGPPPGWIVHEGRHVRDTLYEALRTGDENDRAAAARLREAIRGAYGYQRMLDELSASAPALRRSVPSILARLDEILAYPLPVERRRGVPGFDF